MREPFPSVIEALTKTDVPVTSVDAPSSWHIEDGPPASGPGKGFEPSTLVSLTAPKPLTKWFNGRHFLGGRQVDRRVTRVSMQLTVQPSFLTPHLARKYNLDLPHYDGLDQVVEIGSVGKKL